MKPMIKFAVYCFIMTAIIILACKKEKSCENCGSGNGNVNKPPVAIAKPDTTITLPLDSIQLNGSASYDPDGTISSWSWKKISGPISFNFGNAAGKITTVRNLTAGTYQFELTVTDNSNFSSKDTIQVIVNSSGNGNGFLNISGCGASLMPFGHLALAGMAHSVTAGSKIFFYSDNGQNTLTTIYDTITQTWTSSNLSYGDINDGNKLLSSSYTYPINQQSFQVYDVVNGSFTTHNTPEARAFLKNTVVGNKVVFAGGSNPDSPYYVCCKRIDIYDALSNSWSLVNFGEARYGMTVAGLGNKVFFAGGYKVRYDSLVQQCDDNGNNCVMVPALVLVDRVDIYDLSTNSWSISNLSEARADITTAVVGNRILFAGGENSIRVDIYDASANSWSIAQLSSPIYDQSGRNRAHTVGNKILFTRLWSKTVDIYDAATNTFSTAEMSQSNGQTDYEVAILGNKIVFFTVFDLEDISKNIDIYDASTNTWCHSLLNRSLTRSGIIATSNRVYVAGGTTKTNPNGLYDQWLDDIWILNF